jgi:ABC-2 type transport system permease protein
MNTMTMKWLIRREFWEHKGSMFWAPAIVAALLVLLVGGTLMYGMAVHGAPGVIHINGQAMNHGAFAAAMPAESQAMVAQVASGMYIVAGSPVFIIMIGTLFFYCVGALYNERQDRSILFWKSLPVSDAMTVLSKAITALCVAPVITIALATVCSLVLLLLAGIAMALGGIHMASTILSEPDLYLQPLRLIGLLPVYVVWALPTIGWLLLVSSWAKTKPLLWAVGVPLIALVLVKWFSYTLENFSGAPLNIMPMAQEIVARLLGGIVPGIWFTFTGGIPPAMHQNAHGPDMGVLFEASWMTLATASAWIGALCGAIRLRRWRDEG